MKLTKIILTMLATMNLSVETQQEVIFLKDLWKIFLFIVFYCFNLPRMRFRHPKISGEHAPGPPFGSQISTPKQKSCLRPWHGSLQDAHEFLLKILNEGGLRLVTVHGLMLGFTLGSYHLLHIQHEESVNWHVLISKITTEICYRSQLLMQGCKCFSNYFQNVATGIPSTPQVNTIQRWEPHRLRWSWPKAGLPAKSPFLVPLHQTCLIGPWEGMQVSNWLHLRHHLYTTQPRVMCILPLYSLSS